MNKKFISVLALFTIIIGSVFSFSPNQLKALANENDQAIKSYIEVSPIEGNTVKGSPIITAIPDLDKEVESVTFFAKALNEPESLYYNQGTKTGGPYAWNWATGNPWIPDGKYILKMVIKYRSGEVEEPTKILNVKNYEEPIYPESAKNLNAKGTNENLELTWESAKKASHYEVYVNGEKVETVKDTHYTLKNLAAGETFTIRVKTIDVYDNMSIDDNTIIVKTPANGGEITALPVVSELIAPESNGATPGSGGYSGTINVSVETGESVSKVEFFVKLLTAPESSYWKFPTTKVEGTTYSTPWNTTSANAEDKNIIIKAVAYDSLGQAKTVTRVFLIDNETPEVAPPSWSPADEVAANYIVGYLAGWNTHSSFNIMNDLDASRLTHLNYAFGLISNDMKLVMSDPEQDPKSFEQLKALKKKYPHLKTMLSVGGWGGSANFSEAASTEENRTTFANSIAEFLVKYGFDGIDLDWEYPVTGGGTGTKPNPADKENFPLLLAKIREVLDEQGEKDGVHYLLTIAGAANAGYVKNASLSETHKYLDYIQVMTYDIHGTWEKLADHNAPLYDDGGKTWSVDKAIQTYLDAGVPAEKIVMGVPFYGYTYTVKSSENNGLRQEFGVSGSVTYNRIVKNDYLNNGYVRYWDEGSQVPYLYNAEKSIFISYDDVESIGLKADYIREKGLGGAMAWEITQDHGNDLLAALYDKLKDPIDRSEGDNPTPGEDDQTPGEDDQTPGEDDQTPGEDDQTPGEDDQTPGEDDQTKDDSTSSDDQNGDENKQVQDNETSDENTNNQEKASGKELPNTSTDAYFLLVLGIVILIGSSSSLVFRKLRR
ncbi:glycosyl hydrolase family 18 protein [Bacillus kwashiorkori]|uniref:glycosyl hydrolase family 18 protein n=1 Tax=Bacillus kwashiorkori TaxID=1522318 RepID=UPI000782A2BC|nr:glycosyl hydrolase family 18 protein [Bacillus kwashiorkori]